MRHLEPYYNGNLIYEYRLFSFDSDNLTTFLIADHISTLLSNTDIKLLLEVHVIAAYLVLNGFLVSWPECTQYEVLWLYAMFLL